MWWSWCVQWGSLAPSTPLTGRVYLKEKEILVTPVTSAVQSVSRLQSVVAGLRTAPSDGLLDIFRSEPYLVSLDKKKLYFIINITMLSLPGFKILFVCFFYTFHF